MDEKQAKQLLSEITQLKNYSSRANFNLSVVKTMLEQLLSTVNSLLRVERKKARELKKETSNDDNK